MKYLWGIKQIIILILISLCPINNSQAQEYSFRHYTVEDGLASSETYHVFQDSKGYIWIATDNGVSRYDGYEFKNFTTEDGLPDNTVFTIYEDYKNRIWFIPHTAKFSYYYNDSIHHYKYNDSLQKYIVRNANPSKLSFVIDTNETLYYNDRKNNLFVINKYGKVHNNQYKKENLHYIINEDKNHYLYVNKYTLNILDRDSIIYDHTKSYNPDKFFVGLNFFFALKKNKDYYFASHHKILNIKNLKDYNYINIPNKIVWLSSDRKDILWIGTTKGILGYKDLNIFKNPKYHILKNKTVTSVLEDKEGGYWFTTLYDGVYYIPSLFIKTPSINSNKDKNITEIDSDSLNIWLGLKEKIIKINKKDTLVFNFQNYEVITEEIFYDKKNKIIWAGSRNIYAYKNDSIHMIHLMDELEQNKIIPHIKDIEYQKNNLWAAGNNGLYLYDSNKNIFIRKASFNNKINTICTKDKDIYCGCNDGLWKYSVMDSSFSYLGDKNALLSYSIEYIEYNTYHNNFWLGTKSNGIVVYDENDSIYNITKANGLSSNNITSLFLKDNVMWAATQHGLNKITFSDKNLKHSYKIESFYKIQGLVSNEINDIYVNDSLAYAATKKGLSIIDYKNFNPNNYPPPVYIKNISILDQDTCLLNDYNLSYKQNSINIQYVGLMYRNNVDKKYKYQLNINNKPGKWINTKENYVKLSYLQPGKYNFKVLAVNEDGIESKIPAEVSFRINNPYWKTWWFISLMVLVFIFILISIYFIKTREIHKRNELEKKLLKEVNKFKQQALGQQMNPHFIFNTLNSIQYYIYENDNVLSSKYLAKFSKLMRLILDNSQHDTIAIQKEIDAMELYLELESLRLDQGFSYHINIDKEIDTHLYKIYPLLIQPYLENSIWHGLSNKNGEKILEVNISSKDDYFLCTIKDNGIGREKAMEIKNQKKKKHKSHGTNITGKRIETINKLYNKNFKVEFIDLKDDNDKATGTKVIIRIPKIIE